MKHRISITRILPILLVLAALFALMAVNAAADSGAVVFVKDGGKDTNDGLTADTAINSLTKAYGMVANGGTVVICAKKTVTVDWKTPVTTGPLTITSVYGGVDYRATAGAELAFKGSIYLNGETTIENLNIHVMVKDKAIACNSNKVLLGDGIVCTMDEGILPLSVVGGSFSATSTLSDDTKGVDLTINSGTWRVIRAGNRSIQSSPITDNIKVTINGGTYTSCVVGGGATKVTGNIDVTINGGTFNELISASYKNTEAVGGVDGNVRLTINGGTFHKTIDLCKSTDTFVTGTGTLTITGGDFSGVTAINGTGCAGGVTLDDSKYPDKASLSGKLNGFDSGSGTDPDPGPGPGPTPGDDPVDRPAIVFLKDAGVGGNDNNDGLTADTAITSLTKAYTLLPNGGTIVICAKKTVTTDWNTPVTTGPLTITSVYDGVDYRTTASAELVFKGSIYLNGETTIENLNIRVSVKDKAIACNSNKVLLGDGIVCTMDEGITPLSVVGGSFSKDTTRSDDTKGVDLTINSGTWRVIRAGNRSIQSSPITDNIKVTINGGTYTSYVIGGGATKVTGNIDVTINGGTFNSLISASYKDSEAIGGVDGDVTLTINGGTFTTTIDLCLGVEPKVTGKGTLTVTGGVFTDVIVIGGANCAGGSKAVYDTYGDKATLGVKLSGFDSVVSGETVKGDFDGNGQVTNGDVAILIRYLSGWTMENDLSKSGDVNGDGKVNNRDALCLIQKLANWGGEMDISAWKDGWNSLSFTASNGVRLLYQLYMPAGYDAKKAYPCILYMHSSGVRCDDNSHIYTGEAQFLRNLEASRYANDVIVLAPCCPSTDKWVPATAWNLISYDYETTEPTRYMAAVLELFSDARTRYAIDESRLYTYGMSMGGFAVYDLLTRNPGVFAAAIPVAGAGDYDATAVANFAGTAMWIFHGDADASVPVESSRNMKAALDAAGRDDVRYTEFPGAGHGIWVQTANTEGLLDWLFSQHRS